MKPTRGSGTRILCFAPGVYTTAPFVHEYREEMFLFSSDLTIGNDDKGQRRRILQAEYLCCRSPGAFHGPHKSETGRLLMEIHYFDPA